MACMGACAIPLTYSCFSFHSSPIRLSLLDVKSSRCPVIIFIVTLTTCQYITEFLFVSNHTSACYAQLWSFGPDENCCCSLAWLMNLRGVPTGNVSFCFYWPSPQTQTFVLCFIFVDIAHKQSKALNKFDMNEITHHILVCSEPGAFGTPGVWGVWVVMQRLKNTRPDNKAFRVRSLRWSKNIPATRHNEVIKSCHNMKHAGS